MWTERDYVARRDELDASLRLREIGREWYGPCTLCGIQFALGRVDQPNVLRLERESVHVDVAPFTATYILFLHAVADRDPGLPDDLADCPDEQYGPGNEPGDLVSEYCLAYEDDLSVTAPIRRRFAIQQNHIDWAASPFAAMPAFLRRVTSTSFEAFYSGKRLDLPYRAAEKRHTSGRT